MGKTDPAERHPSISYMNFQIPISVPISWPKFVLIWVNFVLVTREH